MAEQIQINALIRPELDTGGIVKKVSNIQSLLSKIKMSPALQKEFNGLFNEFNTSIEKINGQFSKGFETKGAVKSLETMTTEMRAQVEQIAAKWQEVSSRGDLIKLPPGQEAQLKQINTQIAQLKTKLDSVSPTSLQQVTQAMSELKGKAGQRTGKEVMELIDQGQAQQAINLLDVIIEKRQRMNLTTAESKAGETFRSDTTALLQMRDALLGAENETRDLVTIINQLDANGAKIIAEALRQVETESKDAGLGAKEMGDAFKQTETNIRGAAAGAQQMSSEMDQIRSRIQYFFSLANAVQLVRRALRQTFEAAKELDAAMTETAVVTDFSVGDMWNMLPTYTKTAQELGATTQGVYETLTLFYQQGLDTNEAIALGTETLKMARVAGMDYEEATSKMTAALRGFNMELNELSAQKVNDVYSELAAITAADTDQIATAMTKTASIANSANMEFETTAAFLAQIVETTQESAETAGTAMKTVIARFTELKKDPSLIGEVDGEVIDANKIETALNSIGVALRDGVTGQFRDLDDVFLDIAQKWEGLDTNTQRYIATIAAGSRQQSRFIAMMSDYERTMELVTAANSSAGSSQKQFDKTLESMEAKLNQLKNTWQEYTLGLMDSDSLKGTIDLLNKILSFINKLTDAPGILGSASKAFVGFFTLFAGKKIFNILSQSVIPNMVGTFTKAGTKSGMNFSTALIREVQKTKLSINAFRFNFNTKASAQAAKDIVAYQGAVQKATVTEHLYESALQKRGVTQAQVAAGEVTDTLVLKGNNAVKRTSIAVDEAKVKAISQLALTYGLTNEQAEEMFAMNLYGISTESAAIASKNGLTLATLKEEAVKRLGTQATEEEIKAEITKMIFEKASLKQKYVLLALKLKDIAVQKTKIISDKLQSKASLSKAAAYVSEKIAAMGATAATIAFTAVIAAAIAVVALLVAGIVAIVKAYQNWQQQTVYASKRTEKLKDEVKEAVEAYEELKNTIEDLENLEDSLAGLQKGTAEWKKAVAEVNAEVLRLVDLYPFLAQYLKMEGGVFSFTEGYDDAILNHQADQLQAKQLLASSASLTETQIKWGRGEDDWANQTKELLTEFVGELEDGWMLTASVNGNSAATSAGTLDEYSFSMLAEKYIKEGSITEKDYIDAVFGEFGSNLSYTVDFDLGNQGGQDTGFKEFYRLLAEKQPYYSAIAQSHQADQISAISSANDMSKYTANEEQLVYKRLTELMDNRTWKEDGQTVTYDDDKKIKAEYIKLLKNADDSYSYNISGWGETKTLSRTKAGKTEYRNQEGEWQEESVKGLTMDEAYKVVKNSKVAQITEADEHWVKRINDQISTLDETRQEKARYLINSEATSIEDIEGWFTRGNRTTAAFEDAIKGLDEDSRYLVNLANSAQKTKETFNESSNALLSELAEGKSLSEVDSAKLNEVVGQLGLIKGLYDENKTAAEEWTLVSQQGSVAQASYLLGIQQKLESNATQLSKQALENYAETKTKLLQEQAQLQSEINKATLKEKNTHGLSDESEATIKGLNEVGRKLQDLEEIYFEYLDSFEDNPIVLKVETDNIVGYADTVTKALSVIDEGFKVNRESFETLMQTFPQVLEGAQVLSDGTVQLKRTEVTEILNAEKEKLKGTTEAQITDLENAILVAQGKRDAAQAAYDFLSQESVRSAILESQSYEEIKGAATGTYSDTALAAAMSYQMSEKASSEAENAQVDDSTVVGQELSDSIKQADTISWQSYNNMINYADHYKLAAKEAAKAVYATSTGKYWTVDGTVGKYRTAQGAQGTYNTEEVATQTEETDDGFELNIDPNQAQSIIESFFGQFKDTDKTDKQLNQLYDDYLSGFSTTAGVYDAQISNFENQITLLKLNMSDAFASWDNLMAGGTTDRSKNSSDKEDKWEYERDYDANIKAQIAAAQKKEEKLQEEYQQLLEDENATEEDIYAKRLEMLGVSNEIYDLIEQQRELDEAEVKRLEAEHKEWSHLKTVDANGAVTWDDEAIKAMGFSSKEGEEFKKWQEETNKAYENLASTTVDAIKQISASNDILKVINNEYDELYNIGIQLNELARQRQRLEEEYQNLLSNTNTNLKSLTSNLEEQRNLLEKQRKVAEKQIEYEEFKLNQLLKKDYSKYLTKNPETGLWEADVQKLDKVAAYGDEELYNKITEYVDKVIEAQDKVTEARETEADLIGKENDLRKQNKDAFGDLEKEYYEAIIEYMENQIEEISNLYDSIEDSNSRIIDSINKSLELQRQERSNAETEQDIVDMRNKLAYLQMDTSGANANEILTLQAQLQEKEEDYTDALIDQKINELERQNDMAAEQRERQIQVLEWSHEAALKNGFYLQEAQRKLRDDLVAAMLGKGEGGNLLDSIGLAKTEIQNVITKLNSVLGSDNAISQTMDDLLGEESSNNITAALRAIYPTDFSMSQIINKNEANNQVKTQAELDEENSNRLDLIARSTEFVKEARNNLSSSSDARDALRLSGEKDITFIQLMTYDVDNDGMITDKDAQLILQKAVGKIDHFATGGLANYTGPAWLDGTKSRPELVLNQKDTQNFLQLKDILASFMSNNGSLQNSAENRGDNYYEIHLNVEKITSDYDVEQLANKVKSIIAEDANSRGVNSIYRRR